MDVRPLETKHMQEALALVWEVFQEFEAPEYSAEGVQEFQNFIREDNILELTERGSLRFWGVFLEDGLAGVLAMRGPAHISLLFVRKAYHRQGIARRLFETAMAEQGKKADITVNSSPYALEAYRRLGFRETGPEELVNGIRFIPMVRPAKQ